MFLGEILFKPIFNWLMIPESRSNKCHFQCIKNIQYASNSYICLTVMAGESNVDAVVKTNKTLQYCNCFSSTTYLKLGQAQA